MAQINRRTALYTLGGGTALILGAGGLWAATRAPAKALEPWRLAETGNWPDPRLRAFAHAILAPSPMNMQPWRIRLDGDHGATLFCAPASLLPASDPFDRQTTIGFGAFIETARIAAAEQGQRLNVTPFPEGPALPNLDQRPIARLSFALDAGIKKDPLFAAIQKRVTNRGQYDTDVQLTSTELDALRGQAVAGTEIDATASRDRVSLLRAVCTDALVAEAATDAIWAQQISHTRIGRKEIEAHPDGIDIAGAGPEAAKALGFLNRQMLEKRSSAAGRAAISSSVEAAATAMAFAWVVTPSNSREDQLAAGAAFVRMHLEAAARGIALHPISAPLQELPQLASSRGALGDAIRRSDDRKIHMFVRLGKAAAAQHSPRWPLEARLLQS